MTCKKCGKTNRQGNSFCTECGQALPGSSQNYMNEEPLSAVAFTENKEISGAALSHSIPCGPDQYAVPRARLLVMSGHDSDKLFALRTTENHIGRDFTNDIMLEDQHVSKQHAKIYYDGQRFMIIDLKSRNGVQVNGKMISDPEPLLDGSLIKLGETILKFITPIS